MTRTTKPRKNKSNKPPRRKNAAYRFSDDRQDPMVPRVAEALRATGKNTNEIAVEAECSRGTVDRFMEGDVLYPRNTTVTKLMAAAGLKRASYSRDYSSILEAANAGQIRHDLTRQVVQQAAALLGTIERISQRARKL